MMKKLAILIIQFYKKRISPLLPPSCRFSPTCSSYAITAIERFGLMRGGLLSLWRILRCNPLCRGGIDPVPEQFKLVPWKKA